MVYTILFLIGLIGMAAMALLGVGHGHAGGHLGSTGGHAGHVGHGGGGHAGHVHGPGHGSQNQGQQRSAGWFWQLLSPLTLMSFCLGAGATGLLLHGQHLSSTLTAAAAAVGAITFYGVIVRPLFSLAYKFVSEPSKALEGTTAKTAEAASKFDASGRGVVKLNVDGQVVRVLAELDPEDRLNANLIKPGDSLTVTAVDGHKNTCMVTRL